MMKMNEDTLKALTTLVSAGDALTSSQLTQLERVVHKAREAAESGARLVNTAGRRRRLVAFIVMQIGDSGRVEIATIRAEAEARFERLREPEFGPAMNKALDVLRKRGRDYQIQRGYLVLLDDVGSARTAITYARGARRKYARAADKSACVKRPAALPDLLRKAHEGAAERLAIVQAAARRRKRLPGVD